MFSFSRFRGTDDGRSDEDEVPDVKESQENEYGSGVGFDDYGKDSFEDVAERMEELNGYTVQQVDHSLEEVGSHVELNCDIIQHNSDALEEGAESKEVKLPE
jgi:methyl-accepting chemotaxis protein